MPKILILRLIHNNHLVCSLTPDLFRGDFYLQILCNI